MNVVPPYVPMSGSRLESWADGIVTFTARSPEAMPAELAKYLELGAHIAEWLPESWYVHIAVEPDWDGCSGRWLNIAQDRDGPWVASLCACLALESSAPTHVLDRTLPLLAADGWDLRTNDDPDEPWGYWELALALCPKTAAETALRPALALFGVHDPRRWFVAMNVVPPYEDADGRPVPRPDAPTSVDLRAWRNSVGLAPPPPTIAPRDTEPWATLCEAGLHHMHAPPCWEKI